MSKQELGHTKTVDDAIALVNGAIIKEVIKDEHIIRLKGDMLSGLGGSMDIVREKNDGVANIKGNMARQIVGGLLSKAFEMGSATLLSRVSQLESDCRMKDEALKPFASAAEVDIGSDETNEDIFKPMSSGYNRAPLPTVGDFRRALAALSPAPQPDAVQADEHFLSTTEQEVFNDALMASVKDAPPPPAHDVIERDARRYRRLQVLGVAPYGSKHLDNGTVLRFTGLDAFVDEDMRHYKRGDVPLPAANPLRQSAPVDRDSVYREANQEVLRGLLPFIPEKDAQKAPDKTGVDHLRTMIYTVLTEKMPSDKVARWTGFIQGVLCARDYISVEEERDRTRPIFAEAAELAPSSPPADAAAMREACAKVCDDRAAENKTSYSRALKRGDDFLAAECRAAQDEVEALAIAIRALPIPASPTDAAVKALVEDKS